MLDLQNIKAITDPSDITQKERELVDKSDNQRIFSHWLDGDSTKDYDEYIGKRSMRKEPFCGFKKKLEKLVKKAYQTYNTILNMNEDFQDQIKIKNSQK